MRATQLELAHVLHSPQFVQAVFEALGALLAHLLSRRQLFRQGGEQDGAFGQADVSKFIDCQWFCQ